MTRSPPRARCCGRGPIRTAWRPASANNARAMTCRAHTCPAPRLDWVGDPAASLPCAYRQLATLAHLADSVGFAFQAAGVGDPDPLAAICDALHKWPADGLLLCTHGRRAAVSHPLDLAHRTGRTTGLPVSPARARAPSRRALSCFSGARASTGRSRPRAARVEGPGSVRPEVSSARLASLSR